MNSLLPSNRTKLEQSLEQTTARTTNLPVKIQDIYNPTACPADFLPFLAYAMSLQTEYALAASEPAQRALLQNAYLIHQQRGTIASVKRILSAMGHAAEIVEGLNASIRNASITRNGHNYRGKNTTEHWAHVRIYLKKAMPSSLAQQLRKLILLVLPVRCHLAGIHYPGASITRNGTYLRNGSTTRGAI